MQDKSTPGAYPFSFLTKPAVLQGSLNGLRNEDCKNALGIVMAQRCIAYSCDAVVNLARVQGDHIIAAIYGGSQALRNRLPLCRSHNSSKLGTDLLDWWQRKQWPSAGLPRWVICHYCRACWQQWGAQVHQEPAPAYLMSFLDQRAALLPSDAHRQALAEAAVTICALDQRQQQGPVGQACWALMQAQQGPYLSPYGVMSWTGGLTL
jgi:hypothetical protein